MNSKNSSSTNDPKKIKRRNFFVYLGAGALGALALTRLPFKFIQEKYKAETGVKVKANPYAVKRDITKGSAVTKGNLNG